MFTPQCRDLVAFYVEDRERSCAWYERVLFLKKKSVPEWDPHPVFMLAGTTGVALFKADLSDPVLDQNSCNVRIEHFAFHLSNEDFKRAIEHYEQLKLSYTVKDHTYFHSVYTRDPDDHIVELTTLVSGQASFYDV